MISIDKWVYVHVTIANIMRTFSVPQQVSSCSFPVNLLLPRVNHQFWFPSLIFGLSVNYLNKHVLFCVCVMSRFIHPIACNINLFILIAQSVVIFNCTNMLQFIYPLANEHLSCFQNLVIMNKASMSMSMQVFFGRIAYLLWNQAWPHIKPEVVYILGA